MPWLKCLNPQGGVCFTGTHDTMSTWWETQYTSLPEGAMMLACDVLCL